MLLIVAFLSLVPACGDASGKEGPARTHGEWEKPWADRSGEEVSSSIVTTHRGPEHCDWQSAVFLYLGWPPGTEEKIGPGRQYVRDPEGLFSDYVVAPLDRDARLPADAKYTGYHRGDVQLWLSKREAGEVVYIVRGNRVERWPRTKQVIACA